ncbi:MAG TPA: hypothetical protein VMI35_06460 [Puia sp.]|nr:hypothetical protein [Puia sp.]
MKPLFLKIFLVIAVTLIGSGIIFGILLPQRVLHANDSYINRWQTFYAGHDKAELLCIGSSRVHRHCDPAILSAQTHLKTEVVATAGANFYFFEKLYRDYLARNPRPKLLVVGIDPSGLGHKIFVPNPEYFFPFVKPSDAVAGCAEYSYIKYCKPLGYFYYKEIYFDLLSDPVTEHQDAGYLPVDKSWDDSQEPFIGRFPNGFSLLVSDQTIADLMRFMAAEQKNGVNCVGLIAPEYSGVWRYENNRQVVLHKLYNQAEEVHVRILNFSDSSYPVCFNRRYFFNSQHLNKQGAEQFSRDLADSLTRLGLCPSKATVQ